MLRITDLGLTSREVRKVPKGDIKCRKVADCCPSKQ